MGNRTWTLALVAIVGLHSAPQDATAYLQGEWVGNVIEIKGLAYWKKSRKAEAVKLAPKGDKDRPLHSGEMVRCDSGGLLRLLLGGEKVLMLPSSDWYELPRPSKVSLAMTRPPDGATGVITEIKGEAYWKKSSDAAGNRLDPHREKGRPLKAGELVRCDSGGLVRIALASESVLVLASSEWYAIPATARPPSGGSADENGERQRGGRVSSAKPEEQIPSKEERERPFLGAIPTRDTLTGDTLTGRYEGAAKSDQIGDIPLTVEIKNDNGKLSGKIETPQGPAAITGGTFENGKIVMKFDAGGNEGTLTAVLDGEKISGKWELGGQGGAIELERTDMSQRAGISRAASPASPPSRADVDAERRGRNDVERPAASVQSSAPASRASSDPISGEWYAVGDSRGTSFNFTLRLSLEGDKVVGFTDWAGGAAPLRKGTLVRNRLSFAFETPNGTIAMTATMKDGKLVGEFNIAGQSTGRWKAARKKN